MQKFAAFFLTLTAASVAMADDPNLVPEPGSSLLIATTLAGLILLKRKTR